MKMIMQMKSPESGLIEFKISEGSMLQAGSVMASLELDDSQKIRKNEIFVGTFPDLGVPHESTNKAQELLSNSIDILKQMMAGYNFDTEPQNIKNCIAGMVNCLRDPMMPAYEFMDALQSIKSGVPKSMFTKLHIVCQEYCENATSSLFPWEKPALFPVNDVKQTLQAYEESEIHVDEDEKNKFLQVIQPLHDMLKTWEGGAGSYANRVFLELLRGFFDVERFFSGISSEESMSKLISEYGTDSAKIVEHLFAHSRLEYRVPIVLEILDIIENIFKQKLGQYQMTLLPMLDNLMKLTDTCYAKVHIKCRSIVMHHASQSKYERWMVLE
eukprot:UN28808